MLEFAHGGGVEAYAKEVGCEVDQVIDLSSNINFIKPSLEVDFNTLDISAYPSYEKLYKAIANNYEVKVDELELYNGGSSAIFSLFHHLSLSHTTIYAPAYLEYKKAALTYKYGLELIDRFVSLDAEVKKGSFVIFVNPSTPDGSFYKLEEKLEYWSRQKCTVLIDESFLDFTDNQSVIKYMNKYSNLYILKSMTKFYSSAGIRVGIIISNKKNIKNLQSKEPLWKLSEFDSAYLQAALKDSEFKAIAKKKNIKNAKLLQEVLNSSKLFKKVYETYTNYFLVQLKSLSASEFCELLKPYKIMVRDCSNFDFLDESYIRIAVKSKESIEKLEKALKDIDA